MNLPEIRELEPLLRGLRSYLLEPLKEDAVRAKHANDFVTEKDLYVQTYLKNELAEKYPEIRFLGEEGITEKIDPRMPFFVLDPIDGTTNFVFSYGLSAISLALVWEGRPVLGLVYNPTTDELFSAKRGEGAFLNRRPIHVLPAKHLSEILAAVGTMPYHKEKADELLCLIRRAYLSCIDIRRSGAASIDLCYLAAGRIGIYVESGLQLWDFAASALILEEAGGKITNWSGEGLRYDGASDIAASNTALHPALLELIRDSLRASQTV